MFDLNLFSLLSIIIGQTGVVGGRCPGTCTSKTFHVAFENPFTGRPAVMTALAAIDASADYNLRFRSSVSAVTPFSFDIIYETWSNTRIFEVKFVWFACP